MKTPQTYPRRSVGYRDSRPGQRGFAMMEALMASALIGIVVVGTMQFFSFGQSRITSLAVDRAAHDIARNEMEKVVAKGYANAVSTTDTTQTLFGGKITVTTTAIDVDDPVDLLGVADVTGPEDYLKVTVTVTYDSTRTVTMKNLIMPESTE